MGTWLGVGLACALPAASNMSCRSCKDFCAAEGRCAPGLPPWLDQTRGAQRAGTMCHQGAWYHPTKQPHKKETGGTVGGDATETKEQQQHQAEKVSQRQALSHTILDFSCGLLVLLRRNLEGSAIGFLLLIKQETFLSHISLSNGGQLGWSPHPPHRGRTSFLFTGVFAFGVAALIAGGSAGSAGTTPTGSAIAIAAATSNRAPVASAGTSAGMGKPFSWHAVVFSNFPFFQTKSS